MNSSSCSELGTSENKTLVIGESSFQTTVFPINVVNVSISEDLLYALPISNHGLFPTEETILPISACAQSGTSALSVLASHFRM